MGDVIAPLKELLEDYTYYSARFNVCLSLFYSPGFNATQVEIERARLYESERNAAEDLLDSWYKGWRESSTDNFK